MSKQAVLDIKTDLETKINEQIKDITNGKYDNCFFSFRLNSFQRKMEVLNKILAAFEMKETCLEVLYLHCEREVSDLYNEVKNGGDLRLAEGIITLYNMVEAYRVAEEEGDYPTKILTPCKTYYHAILDGDYIDNVLNNLKDCQAELIELVEMTEDGIISEDEGLNAACKEDFKGYLSSCKLLIKSLTERKPLDLLGHEKTLDHFYDDMKSLFKGNTDIIEACKFAVKIFMREEKVSDILSSRTSFYVRDLSNKEEVAECIEDTASKIKEAIVDDWYVEDERDLRDKKEELNELFIALDYLKALLY